MDKITRKQIEEFDKSQPFIVESQPIELGDDEKKRKSSLIVAVVDIDEVLKTLTAKSVRIDLRLMDIPHREHNPDGTRPHLRLLVRPLGFCDPSHSFIWNNWFNKAPSSEG